MSVFSRQKSRSMTSPAMALPGAALRIAVMTKAGHSNMKTTQRYPHLAGTVFREEADRLEERLLGRSSTA